MFIQDLKQYAARKVSQAGSIPRRLIFINTAVALAGAILSSLVGQLVAVYQGSEGLSGMGLASLLLTVNQSLDLAVQLVLPFWTVGVVSAMLAVVRTGEAGMKELTVGIRRFPVFLRLQLLQTILVVLLALVLNTPAMMLYMLSPFGANVNPDASEALLTAQMVPFFVIYLLLILIVMVPVSYRLRLTNFYILTGCNSALVAMLTSAQQMKGKVWTLVRLDLSFWWYHLGSFLLVGICYLDLLLGLLGASLPWGGNTGYWVCYLLYAVGHLALETAARPWVEGANVCFFQAVCQPPEPADPQ